MKGFRYVENVATLKLDQPACIGRGRCPEVCPHRVFELVGKKLLSVISTPAWSAAPAP